MPAQVTANIKLSDCVYSYSEAAKQSEAEYRRLWRLAFRGFKRMGINGFWEPRTWVLEVNRDNLTAAIPEECLQWSKIGQFNANGELQTIRINNNLTTFHSDLPTRLNDILPEIQDCADILTSDFWFNGWGVYGNYNPTYPAIPFGAGSRMIQFGSCTVDWNARVIVLDPNYQYSTVVLMGIGAPEMNDDFEIPFNFEEAMIDWISWQDVKHLPSQSHIARGEKADRAQAFKASLALAQKEYNPIRLQELYQEAVESYNLGMKP